MTVSSEDKHLCVTVIKGLYGDAVYVTEDQITEEVSSMVETILSEIITCNLRLSPLTTIAHGIAGGVETVLKSMGIADTPTIVHIVRESLIERIKTKLLSYAGRYGAGFIEAYIKTWFDILRNDKKLRICINTAALNWKSPIAIALMGL